MEGGMGQPDLSLVCALVNILGGSIFGFCAVGVNTALSLLYPCVYDLLPASDHTWDTAALMSAVNIGAMIGALSGGEIADRLGRKWTMAMGGFFGLGSIFAMYGDTYGTQFAARAITGLGVGITSSVCGAYVSEMSPPTRRGFLGALFQVFITVGILVANIVCYFILGENRDADAAGYCVGLGPDIKESAMSKIRTVLIGAAIIPGIFMLLVVSPFVPESYDFVRRSGKDEDQPLVGSKATLGDLFKAKRPLVIALMGAVALQLTGINAVMFYCSKFLETAQVKQKILGTVIIMAWNFVTTLFSLFMADRLGRRKLLIPSLAVITVSMIVLAFVVQYTDGNSSSILAFILLGMYIWAFEAGPGVLFWVINNEVFPEAVSQKGFALVNMVQWSFTLLVTFLFPPLQILMDGWVFLVFGIPGLISTVFMLFCLPETKGKTKRDITLELTGPGWIVWSRELNQVYEVQ